MHTLIVQQFNKRTATNWSIDMAPALQQELYVAAGAGKIVVDIFVVYDVFPFLAMSTGEGLPDLGHIV